jgi:CheY-like chemotaxis protein
MSATPSSSPPLKVLIVEDNRETLFIYEKLFRDTGFQVVATRTLAEARRALSHFRPLAVILDILLEAESSWGLLHELKSGEATRTIPVLVVTVIDNRDKALAMGADSFFVKPVDRGWLLEKLRSIRPAEADRILIIDDNEASRYLLANLLTGTRFTVIEAADGAEGLRRARQDRPRAIFLDLAMPGMSGEEVLRQLHDDEKTRDIPVIIHTSKRLDDAERRRLEQAAATILSKESLTRELAQDHLREALARAARGRRGEEMVSG